MERPLAVVMGDMDLVRPLGLAGIPCAVVARPGAAVRYSRFTRAVVEWADPWTEAERLVERLLEFARRQPQPPVLYYQEDRELLLVSRFRAALTPAFRFVIAEPELVEALVDKARFQELAEREGLPVPATCRLDPARGDRPERVTLPFPLLLKPLTRRTDLWRLVEPHGKAVLLPDAAALRALWPRIEAAGIPVLAQELIPGPETRIESYHCYVDALGRRRGEFTGRKIRTYPLEFGHSTALEITGEEDVLRLGRALVAQLDLRGVAKLDFKRAPDNTLRLLEINPRFNLWHHPAALAGVNLPAVVYRDLTGQPDAEAGSARAGVRWCLPWHDLPAALAAGVSLPAWAMWTLGCPARSGISIDDPLPFLRGTLGSRLRPAARPRTPVAAS